MEMRLNMITHCNQLYPVIATNTFVAETAAVIGDVECRQDSSIWFGAVLRGDKGHILVGEGTNIQDNVTVHCDETYPVTLGKHVTVGHNAVVHGCTVEDNVLIGMHATVLNGCHIGKNSIIAAGALLPQGMEVPEDSLVIGVPAVIARELTEEQIAAIEESAQEYIQLAGLYR